MANTIRRAIDMHVAATGAHAKLTPETVVLTPTMLVEPVLADPGVLKQLKDRESALGKLLDSAPKLEGHATRHLDGRDVPVVVTLIRDRQGRPAPGLLVQLTRTGDKRELLDQARTDATGAAVLVFPRRTKAEAVTGTIEVLAGDDPVTEDVEVAKDVQHLVAEIVLDALPEELGLPSLDLNGDGGAPDPTAPSSSAGEVPELRLPSDFTPELCADLSRLRGSIPDPILGQVAGSDGDFRSRRSKLVKRVSVVRLGDAVKQDTKERRRYLVRLRQEWIFLGYTLGELQALENLDPGAVINEATSSVQRAVESAAEAVNRLTEAATRTDLSELQQKSSLRAFLDVTAKTKTRAGAVGGFLGIPGFGIGGVAAGASVSAHTATRSGVDTSLDVNSMLHSASSLWNETVSTATKTLRDVQDTITRSVGKVSPLLSRVTNLVRWTMYETYAVCTHVEDVLEIDAVPVVAPKPGSKSPLIEFGLGGLAGGGSGTLPGKIFELFAKQSKAPTFTDEHIVEYRPFFEPRLLHPDLSNHFDVLRKALARRNAAGQPIATIDIDINYSAALLPGTLRIGIGDREVEVELHPRRSRAHATLHLVEPLSPGELGNAELTLTLGGSFPKLPNFLGNLSALFPKPRVQVAGVRFRYRGRPAGHDSYSERLDDLAVDGERTTDNESVPLQVPMPVVDTSTDPLFVHINNNPHYYFGVLAEAALEIPSLRDDAEHLSAFPSTSELWKLPILGFEGHRAIVLREPDRSIGDVKDDIEAILGDRGAATIVQLAVPGAYGEALQGLLSLTDAAGMIHPALQMAPGPVMPPLAVVDLAGRQLPLTDGSNGEIDDLVSPITGGGGLPT